MSNNPSWKFSPRGLGIDIIQDSSSAHFKDDPIPKMIRELLQNSLDAKVKGRLVPVEVTITDTRVDPKTIGSEELRPHLQACHQRAEENNKLNIQVLYNKALRALDQPLIRCLKVVDSNTTGLQGPSWDALVFQEGSVYKPGEAPGGSYGIGKNAVLNVSDLRTVFYSTRYSNGREGRVEKCQGKATLMSHPNPDDMKENVQHIGFYTMPNGSPILTNDIERFFRLDNVGTGVFVLGFNPRSPEWSDEVTRAIIENFFFAVHHKKLTATVVPEGRVPVVVDHETLDGLFERLSSEKPAHHYYKTIRDQEVKRTDGIGKIGPLNVYLSVEAGPRRTAYVNRNGMLITDSREQKINPIAPRGNRLWPDFAAVVTPDTDPGDEWIRLTENASHDSMSLFQSFEGTDLQDAQEWFKDARASLSKIIDTASQVANYLDTSNLQELAKFFPDEFDPEAPGNRALRIQKTSTRPVWTDIDDSGPEPGPEPKPRPNPDPKPNPDPVPNPEPNPEPKPRPEPGPRPRSPRKSKLERARFIPKGESSAVIAFTPNEDPPNKIRIALRPAGAEWGIENQVEIAEAKVISPAGLEATLQQGIISLTTQSKERIKIEIKANVAINNLAFRIN